MANVQLDFQGLRCPLPTLKLTQAVASKQVNAGDILEVKADCDTFEQDVKRFCTVHKKVLMKFWLNGSTKIAKIQF